MSDTLDRIGPTLLTNAAATIYTVAAATTVVLRDVVVTNTSGTAATLTASIGADATGTRIWAGLSIPANSTFNHSGSIVLKAAEILQAYSGTNNVLTFTAGVVKVT